MTTREVADRLATDCPSAVQHARVVGRWIWISFPSAPSIAICDTLKAMGFHYNRKRSAWQHPCGWASRHAPYDPRIKYGVEPLSTLAEERL